MSIILLILAGLIIVGYIVYKIIQRNGNKTYINKPRFRGQHRG